MTHSHKHSKSKNLWFRMDVPKRLQALAGTTSWKHSLGTSDPRLAAIKRAQLTAHYKGEVIRLDGVLATAATKNACDLVDRALEVLAAQKGSLDAVVRALLMFITLRARQSWGRNHEMDAIWDFGLAPYMSEEDWECDHDYQPKLFPGFEDDQARRNYVVRQRLVEHRGYADGITFQEMARRLLDQRGWPYVAIDVSCLLHVVGVDMDEGMPDFDAAAEHLLRRLTEHQFGDWQPEVREAIAPMAGLGVQAPPHAAPVQPASNLPTSPPASSWVNAGALHDPSQTLSEGLARWMKSKAPGKSAITEATRAVERFIDLYGDKQVASITINDMFAYRNFLSQMPRGLSLPAIKASGKSLRQAVEEANAIEDEAERDAEAKGQVAPVRKRLSPTSIKKDIGGLSAIFAALRSECWILTNPAEKIPVDGYSKGKKVFPFRPEMMKALFESPMFTGCMGLPPRKRAQAGPYVFQDTLYWSFLFGATAGHRMSEVAVALTKDVEEATGPNGEKIVGIFIMDAKNEHSQRVIIVHPHLLSLGFLDYVEERIRLGEAQLFDLPGGGAKKLSERLNAYIDDVLVADRRYVFHSLRHEFADRSEVDVGVDVSKRIMGHARDRLYGLGAPLHHAASELSKIDVSFVDWDRLRLAAGSVTAAAA